jgi:hypothetical protein
MINFVLLDPSRPEVARLRRHGASPRSQQRKNGGLMGGTFTAGKDVPAGTVAVVRSPDAWRALERATALSTLIHQRRLTPSCGGHAPFTGALLIANALGDTAA